MPHKSGAPNVHLQRRAGSKHSNETKAAATVKPDNPSILPQSPPAQATSDGQNLPKVAENRSFALATPAQWGPPIFLRQARGPLSKGSRQKSASPAKNEIDDSHAITVPLKTLASGSLPTSHSPSPDRHASGNPHADEKIVAGNYRRATPLHVNRSEDASEVVQALASVPPVVQSTNECRPLAVESGRNSLPAPSALPSIERISEESSPIRSVELFHGPHQYSIAGSVGGSVASPFVQRKVTPSPASRGQSPGPGSRAENTAHRVDVQAGQGAISSSRREADSPTSSAESNANPVFKPSDASSLTLDGLLHPVNAITRAIPMTTVDETGEVPVVRPQSLSVAQPVAFENRKIQPPGTGTPGSAFALQASDARETPRSGTEEPTVSVVTDAGVPILPSANSGSPFINRVLDRTASNLSPSQFRQQHITTDASSATAVLRRAIMPSSPATVGHPNSALGPSRGLTMRSDVIHRAWKQTGAASGQLDVNHGERRPLANIDLVQRSSANSGGSTTVQPPPAPPTLAARNNQVSQVLPPGDMAQLVNRVYELLVRRLASEKQQRGM